MLDLIIIFDALDHGLCPRGYPPLIMVCVPTAILPSILSPVPRQVLDQLGIEGVLVLEVPHGSPAAVAGLRPTHRDIFGDIVLGDVVVGMEGRPVR